MKPMTAALHPVSQSGESTADQRRRVRVTRHAPATISYVAADRFVLEDGQVTNVCEEGIGVRGTRPVQAGTHVALFIPMPHEEDDLCIPTARVLWANGRNFGISFRALRAEDQHGSFPY